MFSRRKVVTVVSFLIGIFVIFFIYPAYFDNLTRNLMKSDNDFTDYLMVTSKLPEDHKSNNHKDLKPLLLPNDDVLDSMGHTQLTVLYWRYINTIQVLCRNQTRMGSLKDGGKEICIDNDYKPHSPCLVYSFGSNFRFDFELAVMRNFQCEIHTFDPSKKPKEGQVPQGIYFHLTGLGKENFTNKAQWKMDSFSNIRKSLNHTTRSIDILKIDIEGGEWEALSQMLSSGDLKHVKQLCIELHFNHVVKSVTSSNQLKVLRKLYEQGFHIFMRDRNLFKIVRLSEEIPEFTRLTELSLININLRL